MSLTLYLPIDSIAGGVTYDLSGNANHGTCYGGSLGEGKIGGGWASARGCAIEVADSVSLGMGNSFTVAAWIKMSSISDRSTIFSTRAGGSAGGWMLETGSGTGGSGCVSVSSNGHWDAQTVNAVISSGSWYHVAFQKQDAATQRILINGAVITLALNAPITCVDNADPKTIGSGGVSSSTTYGFLGNIDEVRLYNTFLSVNEIQQLVQDGRGGSSILEGF